MDTLKSIDKNKSKGDIKLFNRELSWIDFNRRVLFQARDKGLPLMERLQFLSIVTSNFDEFFQVRVASVKRSGDEELLKKISERAHQTISEQYKLLLEDVIPTLAKNGLVYTKPAHFSQTQNEYAKDYFDSQILPLLTPQRTEELFPNIKGLTKYIAFLLEPIKSSSPAPEKVQNPKKGASKNTKQAFAEKNANKASNKKPDAKATEALAEKIALVAIPQNTPSVVWLPGDAKTHSKHFALTEDLVALFGTALFSGYTVKETLTFKVTRDADFAVDEDEGGDFIHEMEKVLIQRKSSFVVSLCTNSKSTALQDFLVASLELGALDVYQVADVIDVPSLMELRATDEAKALSYPEWDHIYPPTLPIKDAFWDTLKDHDVLLNVPYMSYDPVVKFLADAAIDKDVLALKMTLYRAGNNSPIIDALEKAARNGKQVVVLVELKARFDEERNINWATRLENAGATVIYGLVNLKVHAKIALVIRREEDAIRRYVHLATGNYNTKTAKLYSDLSLFTANFEIAQDATKFFNLITGYSTLQSMKTLFMAPVTLKSELLAMVDREIEKHKTCHNGLIKAKMNSLTDPAVIASLYKASQAGVKVKLNVRGICMLVPGLKGVSENISVISIVDRFLEHSRIFYFQNGTAPQLYLSSADWMERNLDRRIELMFPILDKRIFGEVLSILDIYFTDNTNAHELHSDGEWVKIESTTPPLRAQEALYKRYHKSATKQSAKKLNFVVRRND